MTSPHHWGREAWTASDASATRNRLLDRATPIGFAAVAILALTVAGCAGSVRVKVVTVAAFQDLAASAVTPAILADWPRREGGVARRLRAKSAEAA